MEDATKESKNQLVSGASFLRQHASDVVTLPRPGNDFRRNTRSDPCIASRQLL